MLMPFGKYKGQELTTLSDDYSWRRHRSEHSQKRVRPMTKEPGQWAGIRKRSSPGTFPFRRCFRAVDLVSYPLKGKEKHQCE